MRDGARADESTMDQQTVTLSDAPSRRIAKILGAEPAGTSLRVSVEGGGCSGFQYRYDLVRDAPAADDIVLARDGATVLIDPISLRIYGRLGDRFRRRSDRPVLPDQEPARRPPPAAAAPASRSDLHGRICGLTA